MFNRKAIAALEKRCDRLEKNVKFLECNHGDFSYKKTYVMLPSYVTVEKTCGKCGHCSVVFISDMPTKEALALVALGILDKSDLPVKPKKK